MSERASIQKLMPLMREFGGLERKRLGEGVTPLEFQRWLDLKKKIGARFKQSDANAAPDGVERRAEERRVTRLLACFKTRNSLKNAIITNVSPAGFFLATPFAAEVGTLLLVRVSLQETGESVDIPCRVVTSIVEGAHTLSTMSMGMGLKFEKLNAVQAAGVSQIFEGALDSEIGLC